MVQLIIALSSNRSIVLKQTVSLVSHVAEIFLNIQQQSYSIIENTIIV